MQPRASFELIQTPDPEIFAIKISGHLTPRQRGTVEQFIEKRFKLDVVWALKHAGKKHYQHMLDKQLVPALGHLRLPGAGHRLHRQRGVPRAGRAPPVAHGPGR